MISGKFISLGGLIIFLIIAWLLSENRRKVDLRLVIWGVALQFLLAIIILKTYPGLVFFKGAGAVMTAVLEFSTAGSAFLFGELATNQSMGAIVAFKVLPTIIFISSLMSVLSYFGIIQAIIKGVAWIMQRTMRASGVEAFISASFIFMGIEAITAIKSYLKGLTRSELLTLMTAFMSTIAGSVMAAYVSFGASAGHLLAASVMSAPAAIVISKIMIPEVERGTNSFRADHGAEIYSGKEKKDTNLIEAASSGAIDGMKLAVTIGAILIAFVSIIAMADSILGYAGTSFEGLAGYAFAPAAFIMDVPYDESLEVGKLLAIKIAFNEFISYQRLAPLIESGALSPRSTTITTYALCSFANLGSLAILIGGIGTLAPERRIEVAKLGLRALLAGSMAGFMTATIAGVLT